MEQNDQIEVHDTYEAAYYYISGAKLIDARSTPIPWSKRQKYLFNTKWIITLRGVPEWAKQKWGEASAVANVRALAAARKKIKRFVKENI